MRKLLFLFLSLMLIFAKESEALNIPDKIGDWNLESEFVTPLITDLNSQDFGRCIYRNYSRKKTVENLTIIHALGKGFGNLNVPLEIRASNSKTVMQSQSVYEILEVAGHKAIFEKHENLPDVLSISVGDFETLTLESYSLKQTELVGIAEEICYNSR